MKKEILAFLLCAVLLLCIGCQRSDAPPESIQTSEVQDCVESDTGLFENDAYRDIVCVEANGFQQVSLSFEWEGVIFSVSLPKEWKLEKCDGGFDVMKNGKQIGSITPEAEPLQAESCVATEELGITDVEIRHDICYDATYSEFYHLMVFTYTDSDGSPRGISLKTDYREISAFTKDRISVTAEKRELYSDAGFGKISLDVEKPRVLIMGNSFVASSSVADILRDMSGNRMTVQGVSIGMATVRKYANGLGGTVDAIASGAYDAVFLCGFYEAGDAGDALNVIVDACKKNGTKLIVFPAHNENASHASAASSHAYTDFLNWKGELEFLIEKGVDYYDLCMDDTYDHSKPLAGYVGAHMIYRAIFGEVPPVQNGYSVLSASELAKLPDGYIEHGGVLMRDRSDVLYFE